MVYIAGYYNNGSFNIACWWRNGILQPVLEESNGNSEATSIFVRNSNVYITGYYNDGVYPYVATYWINGTRISEDLFNEKSRGMDIFVTPEEEVFVAGFYFNAEVPTLSSCYWADTSTGFTSLYSQGLSFAYSIINDEGTLYSSGFYQDATDIACYWIDQNKIDLDNGRSLDIAVDSGSVYAAGYYFDGSKRVAAIWLDGVRTNLYDSRNLATYMRRLFQLI